MQTTKEFIYQSYDYKLYCTVKTGLTMLDTDCVHVQLVSGDGSLLAIPDTMTVESYDVQGNLYTRELPVSVIEKKACLGHRGLLRVEIGSNVREIEEWAFAQCENLKTVVFSGGEEKVPVRFGKGVFEDCRRLEILALNGDVEAPMAALLGAVPYRLDAEYLLTGDDIGGEHWYAKWDNRLQAFLNEDDEEGYTNIVLCGEEDIERSVPGFMRDKRRKKSQLCLLRLAHPECLSEDAKAVFTDYLLAHTKGAETEEAWEVLIRKFGDDVTYFELFASIGAIHADNIDAMIVDMKDAHAETKAFLMKYKQENLQAEDVFGMFTL